MEVKELGHLVLYVRDASESARFYRDVLGWRQVLPAMPGIKELAASCCTRRMAERQWRFPALYAQRRGETVIFTPLPGNTAEQYRAVECVKASDY